MVTPLASTLLTAAVLAKQDIMENKQAPRVVNAKGQLSLGTTLTKVICLPVQKGVIRTSVHKHPARIVHQVDFVPRKEEQIAKVVLQA